MASGTCSSAQLQAARYSSPLGAPVPEAQRIRPLRTAVTAPVGLPSAPPCTCSIADTVQEAATTSSHIHSIGSRSFLLFQICDPFHRCRAQITKRPPTYPDFSIPAIISVLTALLKSLHWGPHPLLRVSSQPSSQTASGSDNSTCVSGQLLTSYSPPDNTSQTRQTAARVELIGHLFLR
jgi:hypothetical protein